MKIDQSYRAKLEDRLLQLLDAGFDRSFIWEHDGILRISVKCWQCEAMNINGIPCHEFGCPNKVNEEEE